MKNRKKLLTAILVGVGILCLGAGVIFALRLGGFSQKAKVNVEWYEEDGKEFVITTAEELRGIAELSKEHDFKGQTVKLGADIVLNEGDYTQWTQEFLKTVWRPIEGFAGTFDGQGHTISGLYCVGNGFSLVGKDIVWNPTGMFIDTTDDALIRDFRIVNSYCTSSGKGGMGSIIGRGHGTVESVYSSATLVATLSVNGGLVGEVNEGGSLTLRNCQFDGEMLLRGESAVYTGGMVGYVNTTKGRVSIEHCLFSGNIISEKEKGNLDLGGFIGVTNTKTRVKIEDCLSAGTIDTGWTRNTGSVIGSHTGSLLEMINVYADLDCFNATVGVVSTPLNGYPLELVSECFVGENALKWTELDFENYWTVVEGGSPVLRTFADKQVESATVDKAYNTAWYDTNESTYTINTLEELYGFYILSANNTFAGKTVKLGADIKVNEGTIKEWKKEAPKTPWYPIKRFAGTFDGDGHTISGIYLQTAQRNSGLFTETTAEATLKNFKLKNSYFEFVGDGIAVMGSVVGVADGTLDTIYSDAVVSSDALIFGGFAGNVISTQRTTFTNCWYDGEILVGDNGGYVGGIAGQVENGSHARIMHCLNSANITATKEEGSITMGGIVGVVADDRTKVNISDTLNVGVVSIPGNTGIGSMVSTITQKTTVSMENCYVTEESCDSIYAGNHGKIDGLAYRKAAADLSGYMAYEWTLLDFDKYWAVVKNGTPILQSFAESVPSLKGRERKIDISWYKDRDKVYTLKTAKELYGFYHMSYMTDFKDKTVRLGKDITVNKGNAADWQNKAPSAPWYAIYKFAGTFDGRGHTISGIYMKTGVKGTGLFGATTPTTVLKNFKLKNSYIETTRTSASQLGSVVGIAQGRIDTVYSDAIVVGNNYVIGGIIGDITSKEKVVVSNCWYDGTMKIGDKGGYIGGIAGHAEDGTNVTIQYCLNSGDIIGAREKGDISMGGIIGVLADENTKVTIRNSLNVGLVDAPCKLGFGSIAGYKLDNTTLILENCYATEESCANGYQGGKGTLVGNVYRKDAADLSGYMAYEWTFLDFAKYWAVVEGSTPILKSFATSVPSVAGHERKINIDWYKEKSKTYTLNTPEELYGFYHMSYMTDFEGKTVRLGKDITINKGNAADWQSVAPSAPWYAIRDFAGTFDGQGHTISGIYMKTDVKGAGLFAKTTPSATLKNFALKNSYVETTRTSASQTGSVVGIAQGTIDTVYSNAIVVGNNYVIGGIIGDITSKEKVVVSNCWYDGSMKIGDKGGYIGGIAGHAEDGTKVTIQYCLNSGDIIGTLAKGDISMGGIIGVLADKDTKVTIRNSLNVGLIDAPCKAGMGSIFSYKLDDTAIILENCYATKESCARGYQGGKGALEGRVYRKNAADITGYLAYEMTFLDFAKYWAVVESDTPILKSFATKVPSLAEHDREINVDWYDGSKTEYVLKDEKDLWGFVQLSEETDFAGKTVKLGADVTINTGNSADWSTTPPKYTWTGIASGDRPFAGTFDGQGHTISGVYMNTTLRHSGLFNATADTAVIKNLQLENSYFASTETRLGSIAGYGVGKFENIYSDAIVVGSDAWIGGLIGQVGGAGATLEQCWYAGTVTNTANGTGIIHDGRGTGGFIGYMNGATNLTNCLNSGTVDVQMLTASGYTDTRAGGFVGFSDAQLTITSSLNTGDVLVAAGKNGGYFVGFYKGNIMSNMSYGYGKVSTLGNRADTSSVIIITCNTHSEPHKNAVGTFGCINVSAADIAGNAAITTLKGFDFENVWAVNPVGTPVLKVFESKTYDISWYDQSKTEFVLKDEKDFWGFVKLSKETNFEGKTVTLGTDIVINTGNAADWANTPPQYKWEGISTGNLEFAGTFDGGMHTISGVYMNTSTRYSGLFNATKATAVIKNLKLKNSYFASTETRFGSIAGYGVGKFENIYSDAIVVGKDSMVGGLIGQVGGAGATLEQCWFAGTVTNKANGTGILNNGRGTGGLIGYMNGVTNLTNCLNSGTVDVLMLTSSGVMDTRAGGFVGHSDAQLTITSSLNTGDVLVATGKNGGYFVGFYKGNIISNMSYGYGNASTIGNRNDTSSVITITCSTHSEPHKNTVGIFGCINVSSADIAGNAAATTLKGFDFANVWAVNSIGTPVLKEFESETYDTSWYDATKTEYVLNDVKDFWGFVKLSKETNFEGKTITLGTDIVINTGNAAEWATTPPQHVWEGISTGNLEFAGTFDGGMHTISGVYMNTSTRYSGLFNATKATAVIKNLKLKNSYFSSTETRFGSIAGYGVGKFENIYSDAIVVGCDSMIGGMIGQVGSAGATLEKCWFAGTVTNRSEGTGILNKGRGTGGLIGIANGMTELNNCLNSGTVDVQMYPKSVSSVTLAGGLVGSVEGGLNFTDCLNTGDVLVASGSTGGYFVGYYTTASMTCTTSYGRGNANSVGYRAITGITTNVNYISGGQQLATTQQSGLISYTDLSQTDITGNAATTTLKGFDFENVWAVNSVGNPVLKGFESEAYDTSWYDTTKTEFVLDDEKAFWGFVKLSKETNFEGKTITLGTDIVINTGNAAEWATTPPQHVWEGISTGNLEFAGTFDGGMHTISGVYMNTSTRYSGLFNATKATAVIKNLKLKNSYFASTETRFGSIAGYGIGKFENIYSDAIVVGKDSMIGGLIGQVGGAGATLEQCWFAGTVTNKANGTGILNNGRGTGGLIGYMNGVTNLTNCLNSGTVDVLMLTSSGVIDTRAGGFVGHSDAQLTITDSLNTGDVLVASGKNGGYFVGFYKGSIISNTSYGYGNASTLGNRNDSNSVITINCQTDHASGHRDAKGSISCITVSLADITGNAATTKLAGFDFQSVWKTVQNGTPILNFDVNK